MTQTIRRDETYDRAVDRLRDMIAATKSPLEKDIGELLTEALPGLDDVSGLLDKKKDLKGAADALTAHARKLYSQRHEPVYVGPGAALPVLLEYFSLTAATDGGAPSLSAASTPSASTADPFDLDALLGGL